MSLIYLLYNKNTDQLTIKSVILPKFSQKIWYHRKNNQLKMEIYHHHH